ncbi:MAG TPA: hypothetical protein VFQ65_18860 [Kofleriaceae bacterium]|nr:hypothetical protein [Kofleriaceae bacterium]
MLVRAALIAMLTVAACDTGHKPAQASRGSAADPWDSPATGSAAPPPARPARPLDMDGTIEGATPALLATPLPGYADAKVGDWRAFHHVTTGTLGNFHATAIAVVTAVTPTIVTIELKGRLDETGEQRSDGADAIPRAFTVAHEIHHQHGDWTASHVELGDDPFTIDGRKFACKKLAFASDDPMMPGKDTRVEVWLSPDVPAGGEVAVREVQKTSALTITMTSDLIGFGDATHTTWGTRPPGL